jgi:5'-3' exonuclease
MVVQIMAEVLLIDMSWCMWLHRFAMSDMGVVDSGGDRRPVGHVYGTLRVLNELVSCYNMVVFVVDSRDWRRYDVLPSYKSGRHKPVGDYFKDYSVHKDTEDLLRLVCFYKNVFFVKKDGYEADDILASYIADGNLSVPVARWGKVRLTVAMNDADVLQVGGGWVWVNSFYKKPVDRVGYIKDKFGLAVDFLPLLWKVVRGDSSDKIPVALRRFPTKVLVKLCNEFEGLQTFDNIVEVLASSVGFLSSSWSWLSDDLASHGKAYNALKLNYEVVRPRLVNVNEFVLKRFNCSGDELDRVLGRYGLNKLVYGG